MWRTGPPADRGRYRVAQPCPLPGGEGFVFKAAGPLEDVALKLLGPVDDERLELLRARWQRVMDNPHPNVARPVELFRGPGLFNGDDHPPPEDCDLLYAVAAWAEGDPLRSAAPLTLAGVGRMAADVAAALAHLHDHCGLVHRDLHPGNIVVGPDGRATLIDLGAARPDDAGHTTTVAGVLGFIAPERTVGPGDRRADAWGLGMLVVFSLLGHPKGRQSDHELRGQLEAALAGAGDRSRSVARVTSMIANEPDRRPTDLVAWAQDLGRALAPVPARNRRRTRVRRVAALGSAALVAVALVVVSRGDGPEVGAGSAPTRRLAPGPCVAADFPNPDVAAAAGSSCPAGPATTFGEAVVQPVQGPDGEDRVVMSSSRGSVLLTPAQLNSYREIAGRDRPENAITFGGYPVSVITDGGVHIVTLSDSGLLVGARADTQSFWMPGPVEHLWRERGGIGGALGLPMTNPYFTPEGLLQDFEFARVLLPKHIPPFTNVLPSVLVVAADESPGSGLAGLALDGRLLRQPTGTVWLVDGTRRRWVPDGEVYECLGGEGGVAADDVAGSDVASLELGAPAVCPGG